MIGPITEVQARAEVRAVYPDATWMWWDAPPIGSLVFIDGIRTATLLGEFDGHPTFWSEGPVHKECPCCTCSPTWSERPDFLHWWRVEDVRSHAIIIVYPPTLKPHLSVLLGSHG